MLLGFQEMTIEKKRSSIDRRARNRRMQQSANIEPTPTGFNRETATPVTGPFSAEELQKFHGLDPIDTHVHIYQTNPAFLAMLEKLNLHVLNIVVPRVPDQRALDQERQQAWGFVRASHGQATLCTTFNPFGYRTPDLHGPLFPRSIAIFLTEP